MVLFLPQIYPILNPICLPFPLFSVHVWFTDTFLVMMSHSFLPAMDILTSFITSTYARQGASPTKLAEAWACGVPTISSCGVGDVTSNTRLLDSGVVIDPNNRADFDYIISNISEIISKGGPELRSRASSEFSLETGASRYSSIYESFIP